MEYVIPMTKISHLIPKIVIFLNIYQNMVFFLHFFINTHNFKLVIIKVSHSNYKMNFLVNTLNLYIFIIKNLVKF